MLARKTVAYEQYGFVCNLTVATANTAMGLFRSSLVDDGLQSKETNAMVKSFLWLQWPVIRAGTVDGHLAWLDHPEDEAAEDDSTEPAWVKMDIQNLTPGQFLEQVPEQVANEWMQAILGLNPHWLLRTRQEIDEDKADPAKKKPS